MQNYAFLNLFHYIELDRAELHGEFYVSTFNSGSQTMQYYILNVI